VQYFDVAVHHGMIVDRLQAGSDLYAFVEFAQHSEAQLALMAMNKRIVLGRVTKQSFMFYDRMMSVTVMQTFNQN